MSDPRLIIVYLYEHLESLDDLAVLVWLGRNRTSYVSALTIADLVGIDEVQALEVLEYFAGLGLVEECAELGLYRYALGFSLPTGLAHDLGAHYGSRLPS